MRYLVYVVYVIFSVCVYVCTPECTCGPEVILGVFFSFLSILRFWVRVSHWPRGLLLWLGWLASVFSGLPVSACPHPSLPVLGLQMCSSYLPWMSFWRSRLRCSCLGDGHLPSGAYQGLCRFVFCPLPLNLAHHSGPFGMVMKKGMLLTSGLKNLLPMYRLPSIRSSPL